jgi:hypothetical protein
VTQSVVFCPQCLIIRNSEASYDRDMISNISKGFVITIMDTPFVHSLSDAFHSLKLILDKTLDQEMVADIAPVPSSWMVLYEPRELKAFFYDLVAIFPALCASSKKHLWRGTLNITFKAEEHHVAIHLALRNGLVTSHAWDKFFNELRGQPCYEYLRELGGYIEPLAWNEGEGQGVTVRLPWAG